MPSHTLYRPQELAFRAQYAELKERAGSAGSLLHGTPGTLAFGDAPVALRQAVKKRRPALRRALAAHPQALAQFEALLG